jgi:hypothetical protein
MSYKKWSKRSTASAEGGIQGLWCWLPSTPRLVGWSSTPCAASAPPLVEAAALGRRPVGVELERRWAELARGNLDHALPAHLAALAEVRIGDARRLPELLADLVGRVDLVVTSPPYACEAGVIDKPG